MEPIQNNSSMGRSLYEYRKIKATNSFDISFGIPSPCMKFFLGRVEFTSMQVAFKSFSVYLSFTDTFKHSLYPVIPDKRIRS